VQSQNPEIGMLPILEFETGENGRDPGIAITSDHVQVLFIAHVGEFNYLKIQYIKKVVQIQPIT